MLRFCAFSSCRHGMFEHACSNITWPLWCLQGPFSRVFWGPRKSPNPTFFSPPYDLCELFTTRSTQQLLNKQYDIFTNQLQEWNINKATRQRCQGPHVCTRKGDLPSPALNSLNYVNGARTPQCDACSDAICGTEAFTHGHGLSYTVAWLAGEESVDHLVARRHRDTGG